jgi:predicted enzyme related to lactoylglutathione lyase
MSNDVLLNRIGQIAITVSDLPRAVACYRDQLGLQHLFSTGQMAFFECGGVRLMLAKPEAPEFDHRSSIIYFAVPDIHRTSAAMRERGVRFVDEPHIVADMGSYDLWMSGFRDSEDNYLCLMSEVPKS